MQISIAALILLLLILVSSITAIILLLRLSLPINNKEYINKFSNPESRKHYSSTNSNDFILDPHELKLLNALISAKPSSGIAVNEINALLNLSKLSKENQRQRRHIIVKELNLKLFLVSGLRESIIRVSSEIDKRVKYYTFDDETLDIELIKKIVTSHS
jgi:hypothetical protein